jgi:osmotically-inducible protein OsmY
MRFVSCRWTAVVLAALALGCGDSDPMLNLAQVNADVKQAQGDLDAAKETVVAREADVAAARQALELARVAVRTAETQLADRKAEIDRGTADTLLFRAVQQRLLEDDQLDSVAVAATVSDGVVVLSGSVEDADQRDRAVAITREIPGVEGVESRIQTPVAQTGD